MSEHEQFMRVALNLAKRGKGKVSPNPMVGCVIVSDGKIIGEGWHKLFGEAHAEPNAVHDVKNDKDIEGATVYVTLEPCSHFGKTPPCVELLIKCKPAKVYICNLDPNPLVSGSGVRRLEEEGIIVVTGVLEKEGRYLNRRFFTFFEKQRPYIILKWAETNDGFVARKNFDSKWISNSDSRTLVHHWRSEEDAIMVATNTAVHDNPTLTARIPEGNNPVRVLLDVNLRVPKSHNIYSKDAKTIVFNKESTIKKEHVSFKKITYASQQIDFAAMFKELKEEGIGSIIIEGGSLLLQSLINEGLWDEARVFVSDNNFVEGIKAPELPVLSSSSKNINGDCLSFYLNKEIHTDFVC